MVVRYSILITLFVGAFGALIFNLYNLQLVEGGTYISRAQLQVSGGSWQIGKRGNILLTDKRGHELPVATITNYNFVYAVPKDIDDVSEAAHQLASVLDLDVTDLQEKLSREGTSFVLLQKKVSDKALRSLGDLNIPGIYIGEQPARFYPFQSLASHLIGFVGPSGDGLSESGRYGLESYYDDILKGEIKTASDDESKIILPEGGDDLVLTIEPNIQKEAERIISELTKKYEAIGGLLMVANPQTGALLALAAVPDFDPNSYGESSLETFLNPATQKIYEPGSIFKVLTMAAGIDSGKITPETTYYDKGQVTINGRTISNWDFKEQGGYGTINMTKVIEKSINTGAIFAEQATGHKIFTEYMKKFGFDEKTGIDLPGELAGNITRLNPEKEPDVAFATAAYGQGVAVTPIELLNSVSAIANGGVLMRPYVNADLKPEAIRRVISKETAQAVTDMMVHAVDVARLPAVNGYSLAGKTGTAYIPDFNRGGYTDDVFNTYIGYGPTSNSKFIILVRLEKAKGAPLAGLTVVPAFREMAQFLIHYLEIPPDRPQTVLKRNEE